VDESPVSNKAILGNTRFNEYDCNDVIEELLCCIQMPSRITSFELFKVINENIDSKSLDWKHRVGL
jgi:hypothetical protein